MQSLCKRISVLEQASPNSEKVSTIFIVPMLKAGEAEITAIRDRHSNHWNRRLEETEKAFKDRATTETPRKENQVVIMFGEIAHMRQWRDTAGQIAGPIQNNLKHSLTLKPA